ncbi:hypothetical protein RTBOTA2_002590 [Rhodotorula toruloides]|uniref:Uncharacterized protein n=1 Tax=Rhodotorula toruloides TaxID=5286 RepID=A0A0K3CD44_RHOTO|nr:hypothetical protein RTBOTA2_002590 [Rhodotorula toruloides]PRQ76639.1 hypothetical protein AAT19DRAFT_12057 [Rhodotorula toruloides]
MAVEMGVVGKLADTDPSFSQMLKSIQVLLFLVPASAGFYGAALRLCLRYSGYRLGQRRVSNALVSLISLLATGCLSCQTALLFVNVAQAAPIQDRFANAKGIRIVSKTCGTALVVVALAFFAARAWMVFADRTIRSVAVASCIASSAVLIGWDVRASTRPSEPVLSSGPAFILGTLSGWFTFCTFAFLTYALGYKAAATTTGKSGTSVVTSSTASRYYRRISTAVEAPGLLCLAVFAFAFSHSLSSTFAAAQQTSLYFSNLIPLVAYFSIMFALVRLPPLAAGRFSLSGSSGKGSGGTGRTPPARPPFSPRAGIAPDQTVAPDSDDPQTWRGDAMDLFPGIQLDPEHSLSRPTSPLGGLRDASFASVGAPSQGYDEAAIEMEPTVQRLDMAALAPVEAIAARPDTKRQSLAATSAGPASSSASPPSSPA